MTRRIALDASPLLYLAIGPGQADGWKETSRWGREGVIAVRERVFRYDGIVVTPHVCTEAWNMSGNDGRQDALVRALKGRLRALIDLAVELHRPARDLIADPDFAFLGLADVSLLRAAQDSGSALLTDDGLLYACALRSGIRAFLLADQVVDAHRG